MIDYNEAFKEIKSVLNNDKGGRLTNSDIDEICGYQDGTTKQKTKPSKEFPRDFIFAIWIFRKLYYPNIEETKIRLIEELASKGFKKAEIKKMDKMIDALIKSDAIRDFRR